MNTFVSLLADATILTLGIWGQHWKSKAERLQDVIEYMVQDEADCTCKE